MIYLVNTDPLILAPEREVALQIGKRFKGKNEQALIRLGKWVSQMSH